MDNSLTFTVQLSTEASDFIRRKVESGEYASETEVIARGVEALLIEDALEPDAPHHGEPAFEAWLLNVVGPAYDRIKADPGRAIPIEQVEADLMQRRLLRKHSA